jgi:hypothetical protein
VLCMHPAVALAAVGSVLDEVKGELAQRLGSSANLTRANPSATLANKVFANLDRRENT